MYDLAIQLKNKPGALAHMGKVLGKANISVEGGGVFVENGQAIAHFLFEDGELSQKTLEQAGIKVKAVKKVLIQKLNQEEPGQLGKIARLMAKASVNIEIMYSDHNNQLILVVDDFASAKVVSDKWKQDNEK